MKKIFYFLLILLVGTKSIAQETEKLPAIPWEEIVEINSNEQVPITKWDSDIKIKLIGNYSEKDSITVAKVIAKLDALTETISIRFSNNEKTNFKISFLDTIVHDKKNYNQVTARMSHKSKEYFARTELFIHNVNNPNSKYTSTLESRIAKQLVRGHLPYLHVQDLKTSKRKSVFRQLLDYNNSTKPLNDGDIAIIKEVYKPGFEERLKVAEEQFGYVLDSINKSKHFRRDRNLWWVKNPISVLILPTIILLLLFLYFVKKINHLLISKIKKDRLRFGALTLIALFFSDILIIFCVSAFDFLTIPDDYNVAPIIRLDTVLTTTMVLLVIVFPFLFLLRFIENRINKSSTKIFTKTGLIFLSTGFLPFALVAVLTYFASPRTHTVYLIISKTFVFIMAFASLRALISFFIFKERSLIFENENKLSALKELNAQAEVKLLQSQINPHFLYNALNSIATLARKDGEKTERMALSLSDLFKYTINRKGKKNSTIKDEVEMVQNYLEIEQIRFGDRLKFTIDVPKELESLKIPMFVIQPLIENAVKHGISKNEESGVIALKIEKTKSGIEIIVEDNGPDFPDGLVSGHGLQTVYDLLRLSYVENASMQWQNQPQKRISINIEEI